MFGDMEKALNLGHEERISRENQALENDECRFKIQISINELHHINKMEGEKTNI